MAKKREPVAEPDGGRARKILAALDKAYPDAKTALEYANPLELLVATVLSAQCTDERVNQVTRKLFAKYPTAADYAKTRQATLEKAIHSSGFFRQKAEAIRAFCGELTERHEGKVPADLDQLVALTGVGRKTANLVLGAAFGIPGIVVDTHVMRVSQRLGLTARKVADKIEQDLMAIVPRRRWTRTSDQMVWHGRLVCVARKPRCPDCVLAELCPSSTAQEAT